MQSLLSRRTEHSGLQKLFPFRSGHSELQRSDLGKERDYARAVVELPSLSRPTQGSLQAVLRFWEVMSCPQCYLAIWALDHLRYSCLQSLGLSQLCLLARGRG